MSNKNPNTQTNVDPSGLALSQAKINLNQFSNCEFECSSVSDSELPKNSQDFGYCLGVLHHIPNTLDGIKACSEKLSFDILNFPLSDYRDKPFYFLRTDALDRFGTKLEKRFTKYEIKEMMLEAGFTKISFSRKTSFWVAVGIKS